MTDQNPWARPTSGDDDRTVEPAPEIRDRVDPPPTPQRGTTPLVPPRNHVIGGLRGGTATLTRPDPVLDRESADEPPDPRQPLKWVAAGAAVAVAIGLIVVLVMSGVGSFGDGGAGSGASGLFGKGKPAPPPDTRPELAKRCPPPSNAPERKDGGAPPPPPGPRTVDGETGISYKQYGDPWQAWPRAWTQGVLKVKYGVGQYFVTENYSEGQYMATILSGNVPAAANDALVLDLKCTGQQVVGDVRQSYYPQPNRVEAIKDEETVVGGRPAWVSKFRLHFSRPGLKAKDELVLVVLLDVGRPNAAVLYVSIPGTHKQWDHVLDELVASVRTT